MAFSDGPITPCFMFGFNWKKNNFFVKANKIFSRILNLKITYVILSFNNTGPISDGQYYFFEGLKKQWKNLKD